MPSSLPRSNADRARQVADNTDGGGDSKRRSLNGSSAEDGGTSEARGRLIENQHARIGQHGAGNRHALALTARQRDL